MQGVTYRVLMSRIRLCGFSLRQRVLWLYLSVIGTGWTKLQKGTPCIGERLVQSVSQIEYRNRYVASLSGHFTSRNHWRGGWLVLRAFWTLQRREISAMSGIKPKGPWYRIIGENFAVGREIPCLSRLKISLSFSQHPVIGMLDNPSPVNAFKYYLSSIILLLFLHMSNHVIDVCQVSVRNFFFCAFLIYVLHSSGLPYSHYKTFIFFLNVA